MFLGSPFWIYLLIFFPLVMVLIGLLVLGIYAFTGNSLADLFTVLFGRGAKLTCWHCGQETAADRKTCQHCGQELQ